MAINVNLEMTLLKFKNELLDFKLVSKSLDENSLFSLKELMEYLEVAEHEKEIIVEEVSNCADGFVLPLDISLEEYQQNSNIEPIDFFIGSYGFAQVLFMTNSKKAMKIKSQLLEEMEWHLI